MLENVEMADVAELPMKGRDGKEIGLIRNRERVWRNKEEYINKE